jgi:hypothetical protein
LIRESAGGTINIYAVWAGNPVGEGMKGRIVHTGGREIIIIVAVVAGGGVIGSDIDRVGSDIDGRGKVHLLPPGGGFVTKGARGEESAGGRPKIADMCPGIGCGLVKADTGNSSGNIGPELHPQFH